jgi:hypothetical protein
MQLAEPAEPPRLDTTPSTPVRAGRTLIAGLAALLAQWALRELGLPLSDAPYAVAITTALITAAYAYAANWCQRRWSWARFLFANIGS